MANKLQKYLGHLLLSNENICVDILICLVKYQLQWQKGLKMMVDFVLQILKLITYCEAPWN